MSRRTFAAATLTAALILGGCSGGGEISKSPERKVATSTTSPERDPTTTTALLESSDEAFFEQQLEDDSADGSLDTPIITGGCTAISSFDEQGKFLYLVSQPAYYTVENPTTGHEVSAFVGFIATTGKFIHTTPSTELGAFVDGGLLLPYGDSDIPDEVVTLGLGSPAAIQDGSLVMAIRGVDLSGTMSAAEFLKKDLVVTSCASFVDPPSSYHNQVGGILN